MTQAPQFWSGEAEGRDRAPILEALAWPLSQAYSLAGAAALAQAKPERVGALVVCVGNVSVGGVGKTPVARAIRAWFEGRGQRTATLSRGYGGRLAGPIRVDPAIHAAADVGDEPLLHGRDGLAIISRDRLSGARLAVAEGAVVIVMDDGFQNHALAKDLSVLTFDAVAGIGNGRVLPAGPLREPLKRALARADAAIVMRPAPEDAPPPRFLEGFDKPILEAWLAPVSPPPEGPLVAFAGLGRPQKFFDGLAAAGGVLVEAVPFPDHHPYGAGDLAYLAKLARERSARLVTTEKDAVRIAPGALPQLDVFAVQARFARPDALAALLSAPGSRLP